MNPPYLFRISTVLEKLGALFLVTLFSVAILIFLLPQLAFALGNMFFGDIGPLYNVRIAQYLFERSAYPYFDQQAVPYAHYQLSRALFIQGELYPALDEAKQEILVYPEHTGTYYVLGLTYGYLGRTHEAIDAFSTYIDTHPNTWAGRNDKAWLQFRLGDIDGALATIEPVARNFPLTPWVQNTYCALLLNKNRLEEADSACHAAKQSIERMTKKDWGYAYPGNNPQVYETGLASMRQSIDENLRILATKKSS